MIELFIVVSLCCVFMFGAIYSVGIFSLLTVAIVLLALCTIAAAIASYMTGRDIENGFSEIKARFPDITGSDARLVRSLIDKNTITLADVHQRGNEYFCSINGKTKRLVDGRKLITQPEEMKIS